MINLYSILDRLEDVPKFGVPLAAQNDNMARRYFKRLVGDTDTYSLYRVGTFNEIDGTFENFENHEVTFE